jgi:thiamine biosynthesis lipoprotein
LIFDITGIKVSLLLKTFLPPFMLIFVSCTQPATNRTEFVIGTFCSITLYDKEKDSVFNDVFSRLQEIENLMSVNIPASDVSRINAAAGIESVQVHEDVYKVIERAIYYAEITGGAFDPTVGPLVALWGIGGNTPKVPTQEEIEKAVSLINYRDIVLDANTSSVFLKRRGMSLDLGGIAKGYAADEAAAIIRRAGVKRAIIDLGGNAYILGENKDSRPWRVGIQTPLKERGIWLGILQLSSIKETEHTVVTSGTYERSFEADGKSYHHIFSPSFGYPVENELYSVSIIAHNSMNADALSTAVFVLGLEKGRELIDSLPGTEAVFILKDKSIVKTTGADFTITDNSFSF